MIAAVAVAAAAISSTFAYGSTRTAPTKKRKRKPHSAMETILDPNWCLITSQEKLERLIYVGFTSTEIALATNSHRRTVEDRRRKLREGVLTAKTRSRTWDDAVDRLFTIYAYLDQHKITVTNVRAWLMGRSLYLEEQRPIILLSAGAFETVREAAIAYASGETPEEFLEDREPLPRPAEPAGV